MLIEGGRLTIVDGDKLMIRMNVPDIATLGYRIIGMCHSRRV